VSQALTAVETFFWSPESGVIFASSALSLKMSSRKVEIPAAGHLRTPK
jgi:hypothetical protein